MRRYFAIWWALLKLLMAFLPWLDMATDGSTIHNWWRLCLEGKLECFWWPLGVGFMVLPTLAITFNAVVFW